MDKAGREIIPDEEVRATYFHEISENNLALGKFKRVLRLGVRPVGALYIDASGHASDLDPRSVDAIASLAALALERAHSFIAESNAEAARRSKELRSTVLDGLAHAFKTPLATIQTASSGLLEMPKLGSVEKELASLIEEQAERLTSLTNSALQTAELDEGRMQTHYDKIDLGQLLRQCKEWFAHMLTDHCLLLVEEASVNHVRADSRLLQMALFQLLDNAAKYARPASAITLRAESTDVEVVFSVRNEGSYVAPEERQRIFERFYRSPDTQHKAAGTGIGLSVTRRIAEAHRGRVWVESDPAPSATFFFTLPHVRKEA
jgi:two-component system, OmpR family, sensor histidine kinase KdpD